MRRNEVDKTVAESNETVRAEELGNPVVQSEHRWEQHEPDTDSHTVRDEGGSYPYQVPTRNIHQQEEGTARHYGPGHKNFQINVRLT